MKIKNLTHTAISLALIFISFLIFRGSSNIINAVTVPLILYLNYKKFSLKEYVTLVLMTLIFSLLFFFQQLFFIILYALLGIFLSKLFKSNYSFFFRMVSLTFVFFIGFFGTLNITDFILGTALQQMLLSLMGGNIFFLILFYLFNSIIISLALNFITPRIEKKLIHTNN